MQNTTILIRSVGEKIPTSKFAYPEKIDKAPMICGWEKFTKLSIERSSRKNISSSVYAMMSACVRRKEIDDANIPTEIHTPETNIMLI